MQAGSSSIAASTSLRLSLKRGMAKQAIELASKTSPNLLPVFRVSAALRPNAKHLERVARRIQQQTGICRVAYARGRTGINFTARMARPIDLQMDGQVAFREIGLIYLRVKVCWRRASVGFGLDAVSFCQHAIERLVERSSLPLDDKLLAHLDSEAQAIFIGTDEDFLISTLRRGGGLYFFLFSLLILFFSYFYSSIVFNTEEVSNNLKKSSCFILGIRPGVATSQYLEKIVARLTLLGAIYLIFVCIVPEILVTNYSIPLQIGGTGILIIVNVVLDLVNQIQSHLFSSKYGASNTKKRRVRIRV